MSTWLEKLQLAEDILTHHHQYLSTEVPPDTTVSDMKIVVLDLDPSGRLWRELMFASGRSISNRKRLEQLGSTSGRDPLIQAALNLIPASNRRPRNPYDPDAEGWSTEEENRRNSLTDSITRMLQTVEDEIDAHFFAGRKDERLLYLREFPPHALYSMLYPPAEGLISSKPIVTALRYDALPSDHPLRNERPFTISGADSRPIDVMFLGLERPAIRRSAAPLPRFFYTLDSCRKWTHLFHLNVKPSNSNEGWVLHEEKVKDKNGVEYTKAYWQRPAEVRLSPKPAKIMFDQVIHPAPLFKDFDWRARLLKVFDFLRRMHSYFTPPPAGEPLDNLLTVRIKWLNEDDMNPIQSSAERFVSTTFGSGKVDDIRENLEKFAYNLGEVIDRTLYHIREREIEMEKVCL